MDDREWLADRFEANRMHLRAIAYRMLGSSTDADDAVQESWLRVSRSGADGVENLGGWLTTVVARVCLDMLRSRKSRREDLVAEEIPRPAPSSVAFGPEDEALLADSVGVALLVVLDKLAPAERVAFVLHEMFAVPFSEIGPIVGRSPTASRKLASRARQRVRGESADSRIGPTNRQIVDAFLAAARSGDFDELLAVLDPDVVLRADSTAVLSGAAEEVRGATAVAEAFQGRARAARPALVDGAPGLVWTQGGRVRIVFRFAIRERRIVGIDLLANPDVLGRTKIDLPKD